TESEEADGAVWVQQARKTTTTEPTTITDTSSTSMTSTSEEESSSKPEDDQEEEADNNLNTILAGSAAGIIIIVILILVIICIRRRRNSTIRSSIHKSGRRRRCASPGTPLSSKSASNKLPVENPIPRNANDADPGENVPEYKAPKPKKMKAADIDYKRVKQAALVMRKAYKGEVVSIKVYLQLCLLFASTSYICLIRGKGHTRNLQNVL
ncbi:hypothetical protein OESDEN_06724, partial [Oesophagostomum dentatum]